MKLIKIILALVGIWCGSVNCSDSAGPYCSAKLNGNGYKKLVDDVHADNDADQAKKYTCGSNDKELILKPAGLALLVQEVSTLENLILKIPEPPEQKHQIIQQSWFGTNAVLLGFAALVEVVVNLSMLLPICTSFGDPSCPDGYYYDDKYMGPPKCACKSFAGNRPCVEVSRNSATCWTISEIVLGALVSLPVIIGNAVWCYRYACLRSGASDEENSLNPAIPSQNRYTELQPLEPFLENVEQSGTDLVLIFKKPEYRTNFIIAFSTISPTFRE